MTRGHLRTFLVEFYVPRLDRRAAAEISSRYQDAAKELASKGIAIQWVQSYAAIEDETYLCIVVARATEEVVLLSRRAALMPDHVVQVVSSSRGGSPPTFGGHGSSR